MNDPVSISAIILAALSLAGTVYAKYDARRGARDKMEFDSQLQALTIMHANCESEQADMKRKLTACEDKHDASELDRDELHKRIAAVEAKVK